MKFDSKLKNLTINLSAFFVSLPIIFQAFPYLGWIFFACSPILIFAAYLNLNGISFKELLSDPLFALVFLLVGIFLCAALFDDKSISFEIIKDLLRGFIFLSVSILIFRLKKINEPSISKKIVELLCFIILIIGFTASSLGLFKYLMIKLGFKLDVLSNSIGEYPWGTSLVLDYNFYALTLLVSGLIAIRFWSQSFNEKKSILYTCIACIILNAGILSGSRRFLIIGPLIITTYFLILFFKNRNIFKKSKWICFLAVFSVLSSLIHGGLYLKDSGCHNGKLGCSGIQNMTEIQQRTSRVLTSPQSTVDSRIDRWLYTFEIIEPPKLLFGSGFSYREKFSCKFNDCKIDDYPHSPILSALLYGGLIGVFSVLACFIYALVTSYQILTRHSSHADLALGLIATTLFVSVSGDSLLSMPVFFSMLLISRCVVWLK